MQTKRKKIKPVARIQRKMRKFTNGSEKLLNFRNANHSVENSRNSGIKLSNGGTGASFWCCRNESLASEEKSGGEWRRRVFGRRFRARNGEVIAGEKKNWSNCIPPEVIEVVFHKLNCGNIFQPGIVNRKTVLFRLLVLFNVGKGKPTLSSRFLFLRSQCAPPKKLIKKWRELKIKKQYTAGIFLRQREKNERRWVKPDGVD